MEEQQDQNKLQALLKNGRVAIIDGAFGTEVEDRGFDVTEGGLWAAQCLDKAPELAFAVHKDYVLAGSDIILTASYKASIDDFVRHGYSEEKAITLIKKSVELAKSARDEAWAELVKNELNETRPFPVVAASVSSYGAFLYGEEYTGNYNGISDDDLATFHRKQIHLLAGEKPDILAIETVPCLQEVKVFLKLIQEQEFQKIGVPIWIAVSCKDEAHMCSGEPISGFTELIKSEGQPELLQSIGVNCSSPQYISSLVKELSSNSQLPILVYANTGEVFDKVNKCWIQPEGNTRDKHEQYADYAKEWVKNGAQLIGGCCRTSPQTIKVLQTSLNTQ